VSVRAFPFVLLAALLASRAATPAPDETAISRAAYLMGTRATLLTFDADRPRGVARLDGLLRVLEDTESELSTWRSDSLITRLNEAEPGIPARVPAAVCDLFAELEHWTRETSRAFDPAVGALIAAWGINGQPRVPSPSEILNAVSASGWNRLGFDRERCTVSRRAGAAIDVGGFGKGEALDRAERQAGADGARWLIDLGGQVTVSGSPPGASGWSVDVAHPLQRATPIMTLSFSSGSLATSGGSERDAVVRGRRVGHIIDPRSGQPAPFAGSVVVWHERGLVADILSTALYVMGLEEGLRWAEHHDVAACFLIVEGDRVTARPTTRFNLRFGPADGLDRHPLSSAASR
jgi:thiamine biosynthesis lipoprotein